MRVGQFTKGPWGTSSSLALALVASALFGRAAATETTQVKTSPPPLPQTEMPEKHNDVWGQYKLIRESFNNADIVSPDEQAKRRTNLAAQLHALHAMSKGLDEPLRSKGQLVWRQVGAALNITPPLEFSKILEIYLPHYVEVRFFLGFISNLPAMLKDPASLAETAQKITMGAAVRPPVQPEKKDQKPAQPQEEPNAVTRQSRHLHRIIALDTELRGLLDDVQAAFGHANTSNSTTFGKGLILKQLEELLIDTNIESGADTTGPAVDPSTAFTDKVAHLQTFWDKNVIDTSGKLFFLKVDPLLTFLVRGDLDRLKRKHAFDRLSEIVRGSKASLKSNHSLMKSNTAIMRRY